MQLRRCGPGPTPKARASLLPSVVAPSRRSCTGRVRRQRLEAARGHVFDQAETHRSSDPRPREPVMVAISSPSIGAQTRGVTTRLPGVLRKMSSMNLTDFNQPWPGHAPNVSCPHHVVRDLQRLQPLVAQIQQGHGPRRGTMEGTGVDEPGRSWPDIEGLVGMAGEQVIGPLRPRDVPVPGSNRRG